MSYVILTASNMKKTINGNTFLGKCVTAYDLEENRIVRFVKNPFGAPVESPYCDRFSPLDVVDIQIRREVPLKCQTENVLAFYEFPDYYGKYKPGIADIYEKVRNINTGDSSFMENTFTKLLDISAYRHSLEIIRVTEMGVKWKKCSFKYNKYRYYDMSLTDPKYILPEGQSKFIGDAFLAVSIPTDPYEKDGYYYKFVAAVYPVQADRHIPVPGTPKSVITKTDCILKNGPSCKQNCTSCDRYRPVARR